MRCNSCNVDLAEYHKTCPLCREKADKTENKIKNIIPAPYPQISKTNSNKTNYLKIFFFIYVALSVIAFVTEKVLTGTAENFYRFFMAVPCAWALIIRPFLVKKEYVGSYLILNVIYFSIASLLLGITNDVSFLFSNNFFIPSITTLSFIIMTFVSTFRPKKAKLSIAYVFPIMLIMILMTIIKLFMGEKFISFLFLIVAMVWGCVCLLTSYLMDKKGFKARLYGMFHIR